MFKIVFGLVRVVAKSACFENQNNGGWNRVLQA